MERLILDDIWKQANKILRGQTSRTAVVAYVSQPNLILRKGDILLCDASESNIQCGQTSAQALQKYFNDGVVIYDIAGLHVKMVYTNDMIICGSANLSTSSAENLIEAALVSQDPQAVSQAEALVYSLTDGVLPMSLKRLGELLRIKVIRTSLGKDKARRRKRIRLGTSKWIMRTNPIKHSEYEKEEPFVEPIVTDIARSLKVRDSEIFHIRLKGQSKLRKEVKAGDLLFQMEANDSRKQISVLPSVAVLRVQNTKDWSRIYYRENSSLKPIPWSTFERQVAKLTLQRKILKTTTRQVTDSEYVQLNSLFK